METITLKPLLHHSKECIGLYFKNTASLNNIVKKQEGVRWSQTHKCWYLPLSENVYKTLQLSFKDIAIIENTALREYLHKKKSLVTETQAVNSGNASTANDPANLLAGKSIAAKPGKVKVINNVSTSNLLQLQQFTEMLMLKAYSSSTIKTYRNEFLQVLQVIKNKDVQNLTVSQLKRYMVFAMEQQGISENTAHSRLNALKFYYERVLNREKFFLGDTQAKEAVAIARFFNQDEIVALLKAVENVKHKTMLMLAYSAGLRVSEVVNIRTADIDSKRMCILVKRAKGKKDRMVSLSPVLLIMLREYWKKYKPLAHGLLFEGQNKKEAYSTRSLQLILAGAKIKAGIQKAGSMHALRHSFATHLLDKGTDVTMIMKLLGHNDIKTTLRYLHVTNRDMLQVLSPLDGLNLNS